MSELGAPKKKLDFSNREDAQARRFKEVSFLPFVGPIFSWMGGCIQLRGGRRLDLLVELRP